ncbi:MAG: signal peptidase I [Candidatus Bipolaricaulia bacterium]
MADDNRETGPTAGPTPEAESRADDRHPMETGGLDDQGRPWDQVEIRSLEDERDRSSSTRASAQPSEGKPLLALGLGLLGVETSPAVDRVLDWVFVLGLAVVLSFVVMQVGVARMMVPTRSMAPTIQPGDSFFVDKFTYWSGLNQPEPGDIVVFWHKQRSQPCEHQLLFWQWQEAPPCKLRYVKRLVAIGPATVTIRNGDVVVDGARLTGPRFDRRYTCGPRANAGRFEEGCQWRVPSGKMFVLGDNTTNSRDSRYWGVADVASLIGEPFLRVWPPSRVGLMNGYLTDAPEPARPLQSRY